MIFLLGETSYNVLFCFSHGVSTSSRLFNTQSIIVFRNSLHQILFLLRRISEFSVYISYISSWAKLCEQLFWLVGGRRRKRACFLWWFTGTLLGTGIDSALGVFSLLLALLQTRLDEVYQPPRKFPMTMLPLCSQGSLQQSPTVASLIII